MKKEKNCCEKNKVWRIVAISGALIFLVIIGLTAFKVAKFGPRSSFQEVSEEQKEKALSLIQGIAANDGYYIEYTANEGYILENYDINVDNKIMEIKVDNQKRHILRVSLEGMMETKTYVIDTDNWDIVQSSKIKYYSWMVNVQSNTFPSNQELHRWLHNEMLKRGPDGR